MISRCGDHDISPWQAMDVNKGALAATQRRPAVLSFTKLSGDSTAIANALDRLLHGGGNHMFPSGGDHLGHGG
ncbi:hypothetical protein [Sinorhizobium medicae]|uniref:Uncharacterized protein n=2 Tax=Sinorhizobium medicae TaxID=110321 RepID=A0A508WR02_9HYPH|nr:hypothetical protein [Sinorhizobium medicae]VTZ59752.1 hypothetical protein EMEDMD4_1210010 [Sinorhizobium medicae]